MHSQIRYFGVVIGVESRRAALQLATRVSYRSAPSFERIDEQENIDRYRDEASRSMDDEVTFLNRDSQQRRAAELAT